MSSDRITVSVYSSLINRLLYDTVCDLRDTPRRLSRAANTVINRNEHTTDSQLERAMYQVRRLHNQIANDIRFLDSAFFDEICSLLEIPAEEVYTLLQSRYAAASKAALDLAVKAEQEWLKYLENK